jgi:hypothetical protein
MFGRRLRIEAGSPDCIDELIMTRRVLPSAAIRVIEAQRLCKRGDNVIGRLNRAPPLADTASRRTNAG